MGSAVAAMQKDIADGDAVVDNGKMMLFLNINMTVYNFMPVQNSRHEEEVHT